MTARYNLDKQNAALKDRPPHTSGLKLGFYDVARTKVTNGRQFLPGVSDACYWVRRAKDIMERYIVDLGGQQVCSEAERTIVRRAAVLVIECERLERQFAVVPQDKNVSLRELDMYSKLANSLRRLLDMTGLERRSRDITPTIDAYIAEHANDPDNTDEANDDIIDIPLADPLPRRPNRHDYARPAKEIRKIRAAYLAKVAAEKAAKEAAE